jgi:hypothetical protein
MQLAALHDLTPCLHLAKLGNFFVRAFVLRAKLVARKSEYDQSSLAIRGVKLLQPRKLRRESARTRY